MKKISKIFWNVTQGPWYYRFMKKTRGQKSHATVPLNTVSLHSTVVDHCTISYGTGRVVGTVSYTRTSTLSG